jgi:ribonuclease Z
VNCPASFFPNTELLGADEMRITALGTGMPNQTKAAVSISYLVELGNGDKFLFDIGSGSLGNLFSLRPDFSKLDKVFASHLHVDHVGDFMAMHIGSWLSGRYTPIHVYGPSGSSPELGTRAFVEGMQKGYAHAAVHYLTRARRSRYTSSTTNRKMRLSTRKTVSRFDPGRLFTAWTVR